MIQHIVDKNTRLGTSMHQVMFSLLHAKNIRNDFGVPIWFSNNDKAHQPILFVQLIYTWSKHSMRLDTDPFLSFRVRGHLFCLLYSHIQTAVKSSTTHFGLSAEWFKTQSIRMSVPTIARAANLSGPNIMHMGRWKSLPAPILYQAQSTALNDHILSVISNPALSSLPLGGKDDNGYAERSDNH